MSSEQANNLDAMRGKLVADVCLVLALLLVLALAWQDTPPSTPLGLEQAARKVLARQVGAPSTLPMSRIATRHMSDEGPPPNDSVIMLHQASKQAPKQADVRI